MGLEAVSGGVELASAAPIRALRPGWAFSLYPQAGEGGGCLVSPFRRERSYVARGAARDPLRAAEEAGRRARGKLRRFCATNRLNRLGTLTYAGEGCHDPLQVRADVGAFFRALRFGLGGEALAYVWVPEWHKTGHGLHVHFAVGRYVPQSKIRDAWGRGFVSIKLLGDLPVGSSTIDEARVAARYLGKYVSKSFTVNDPRLRPRGLHRFEVAQGFKPTMWHLEGTSAWDVLVQASGIMGRFPRHSWNSDEVQGWQGAPAVWHQW